MKYINQFAFEWSESTAVRVPSSQTDSVECAAVHSNWVNILGLYIGRLGTGHGHGPSKQLAMSIGKLYRVPVTSGQVGCEALILQR